MDVGVRDTDGSAGVEVRGLLAPYGPGWRAQLKCSGYDSRTVSRQMSLLAHLSDWLDERGLRAMELATPVAAQFLRERREQGLWPRSARSLRPLLGYLHGLQVVPDPAGRYPVTPVEQLVEAYRDYLAGERGLVPGTVRQYSDYALVFLTDLADHGHGVESLQTGQVTDFLVRYCVGRSAGASKCMVVALRSLLRFLHVTGRVGMSLAEAVPSVPGWSSGLLPRGLERMQVAGLLDSCDRECARGRRDYAILLLLTRLGLRVAEVAGLGLDDVDWRTGGLMVHGKGARVDQMPLPEDLGQALADYVRHGRPRSSSRQLFLIVHAPWSAMAPTGVSAVVARAGRRAGYGRFGAHRLRHTVACDLLRAGASLPEIAQLLRHRDERSTAIYAKVDPGALTGLARRWPGETA